MKLRYAVVYEAGTHNLSAYAPDLPGCVATGGSLDKIRQNMREAMTLHLDLIREHGEPIPQPMTSVGEASKIIVAITKRPMNSRRTAFSSRPRSRSSSKSTHLRAPWRVPLATSQAMYDRSPSTRAAA